MLTRGQPYKNKIQSLSKQTHRDLGEVVWEKWISDISRPGKLLRIDEGEIKILTFVESGTSSNSWLVANLNRRRGFTASGLLKTWQLPEIRGNNRSTQFIYYAPLTPSSYFSGYRSVLRISLLYRSWSISSALISVRL